METLIDKTLTPNFEAHCETFAGVLSYCTGMRIYLQCHNGFFVNVTRKALIEHVKGNGTERRWQGAKVWVNQTAGRKTIQVRIN